MFWALVKKLWLIALVLGVVLAIVQLLLTGSILGVQVLQSDSSNTLGIRQILQIAIQMLIGVFLGYKGNEWVRKNLEKSGFKPTKIVQSKNRKSAIQMILDEK